MGWDTGKLEATTAVPEGVQRVRIVEAGDTIAKTSRAEMTTVSFEIAEGSHKGTKLWSHFVKGHPLGDRMMLSLLQAIGLADGKKVVENEELVGKELLVRVRADEFEGMPQARITRFLPLKGKNALKK